MASKFIIREKTTNSYCTSSKHYHFSDDLDSAVLFASRENAEKAIKAANTFFTKEMTPYGGNTWSVYNTEENTCITYQTFVKEYIAMLESNPDVAKFAYDIQHIKTNVIERTPELEAIEVKLCIV